MATAMDIGKASVSGCEEICCLGLIDRCYARGCNKVHCRMPYQWQIWRSDQWTHLPNNQEIEEDYCNPANTQHAGSKLIHFDTMKCGSDMVRRIAIDSDPELASIAPLVTKWVWYWEEAEGVWREFTSPDDSGNPCSISDELEEIYNEGERTVEFAAGNHQYELDFQDMIQTNTTTNVKRLLRRRPVFISQTDIQKTCSIYRDKLSPTIPNTLPDHWDTRLLPATGYEGIRLSPSAEYNEVLRSFNKTMPPCTILSIQRIQNVTLWNFFKLQKDAMKAKAGKDTEERLLFHGTETQHVDAICHDNIDWRLCGVHGTSYGKGSYFAKRAKYSNGYTSTSGTRSMFVCRVLVGDYTTGRKDFTKPPFKDADETCAFDSCVDDMNDPSIFVVFEKSQIYPEYLIQYEEQLPAALTQQPVPVPPTKPCCCCCPCGDWDDCEDCCLDFIYYLFCLCCCD